MQKTARYTLQDTKNTNTEILKLTAFNKIKLSHE